MHILRCASSRTSFKGEMRWSAYMSIKTGGDVTVCIHEKVCKLNIPPAPFEGGDAMVRIHEH